MRVMLVTMHSRAMERQVPAGHYGGVLLGAKKPLGQYRGVLLGGMWPSGHDRGVLLGREWPLVT